METDPAGQAGRCNQARRGRCCFTTPVVSVAPNAVVLLWSMLRQGGSQTGEKEKVPGAGPGNEPLGLTVRPYLARPQTCAFYALTPCLCQRARGMQEIAICDRPQDM